MGAILSQRSSLDNKVHPCAFYSHRLSSAEHNYDVGNRELLAIRLALVEWRHWLEGASVPFIVWTDHQNLEYIRSAKRLNARQAHWALFFGRFDFTISFRPGSKNLKPDALSCQFGLQRLRSRLSAGLLYDMHSMCSLTCLRVEFSYLVLSRLEMLKVSGFFSVSCYRLQ